MNARIGKNRLRYRISGVEEAWCGGTACGVCRRLGCRSGDGGECGDGCDSGLLGISLQRFLIEHGAVSERIVSNVRAT